MPHGFHGPRNFTNWYYVSVALYVVQLVFLLLSAKKSPAKNSKEVYFLEGGIQAWQKQGLDMEITANAPLELQRQVQIAVGILILLGVILGTWVSPGWYILSAFVGAGLLMAGLTGFCGLARLMMLAPWNRI